jgi:hypothetical protein
MLKMFLLGAVVFSGISFAFCKMNGQPIVEFYYTLPLALVAGGVFVAIHIGTSPAYSIGDDDPEPPPRV